MHLRLLQEWVISREATVASSGRLAAAGILRGDLSDAAHRQPLVNGLHVIGVTDGEMRISFAGYTPPAAQGPFQFLVKAQSHARSTPGAPAIVSVGGFGPDGITLRVTDGQGTALPATELASLEIAVEITRYGA